VQPTVGIDVGATLCKVAVLAGRAFTTEHHPSDDLAPVRRRVEALRPARVAATGGGAGDLGETLAGRPVEHVGEFDAWATGAPFVAADEGVALPERYLLVSLGTGTSILSVEDRRASRAGGTAVGGGTALGLAKLILGVDDFATLIALADRGDRRRVDLMVSEVYRGMPATVARNLTASNFAKLESTRPEDVAHALMGLVGETVVLVSLGLARHAGVETVVYGGSTLEGNGSLRDVIAQIASFFGLRPLFLSRGAYCGAVGAAAQADERCLRDGSSEAE
jgi:type II pantothenate kinase